MEQDFAAYTLAVLPQLPASRPAALMVRHSQREAITGMENVFTAPLTLQGVGLAREFGQKLAAIRPLGRIMASPVSRCVDTAVAIVDGAGANSLVRVDDRLSHFMLEPVWNGLPEISQSYPPPLAVRILLGLLLDHNHTGGALDVFVTHDSVVGALAGFLTGLPVDGSAWPQYLEGIYLWPDGSHHACAWWRGTMVNFEVD